MLEDIIKNIVVETVKLTLNEISITKEKPNGLMLNVKETAEYIGMSVNWVYQNLNILPHRKIGRRLSFNTKELDSFLDARKVKNEDEYKISDNAKIKKKENGKYKVI